jgi:predicted transcriptional regulator
MPAIGSSLGQGKVIRALVIAVDRFHDLHEDIVDERARAEAKKIRRQSPSVSFTITR